MVDIVDCFMCVFLNMGCIGNGYLVCEGCGFQCMQHIYTCCVNVEYLTMSVGAYPTPSWNQGTGRGVRP